MVLFLFVSLHCIYLYSSFNLCVEREHHKKYSCPRCQYICFCCILCVKIYCSPVSFTFFIVYIMDIKNIYFSREGRLSRIKFFWYLVLLSLVVALLTFLLQKIFPDMISVVVSPLL